MQWVRPGADCFSFVLQPRLKLFVLPILKKIKKFEPLLKLFVLSSLRKMEKQKFLLTALQRQAVDGLYAGSPLRVVLFCFTLSFFCGPILFLHVLCPVLFLYVQL